MKRLLAVIAAVLVAATVPGVSAAARSPLVDAGVDRATGVASVPDDGLTAGDIVAAKVGLGRFITAHVDRPVRVAAPCPTIGPQAASRWLSGAGLTLTTREFGPAIVWDSDVGGGLVAVRCGVDLNRSSDPSDSVRWSMDVTMLDGQATFAQLAVDIAGRDAEVAAVGVGGRDGTVVSRCTNGDRDCVAAVAVDDLAVILRLEGLPDEGGEAVTRRLAGDVFAEVVVNLAAVPAR